LALFSKNNGQDFGALKNVQKEFVLPMLQ